MPTYSRELPSSDGVFPSGRKRPRQRPDVVVVDVQCDYLKESLGNVRTGATEMVALEQSIGRIDAGDYGYCDETGESIGVGRLLARPTATRWR